MSERWTLEQFREYQQSGRIPDNATVRSPNAEPNTSSGTERTDAVEEVLPSMRIVVHAYRCRSSDSDNCFAKWFIDAAVEQAQIPDDSRKYIKETVYRETKVAHYAEEKTILTIERIQ